MINTGLLIAYTAGIHLGNAFIWVAKWFSPKMNQMWRGRQRTIQLMREDVQAYRHCIWMHCASLGEFEQGRPLLEAWRKSFPGIKIVLTFFSPSGYEIRKGFAGADMVLYLPADLPVHARLWLTRLQPRLCVFVKYEFWWNILQSTLKQGIPTILVAGIFREKDYFFHPLLRPFLQIVRQFDAIFVQDGRSLRCLESHGCKNGILTGDTRVDRVLQMRQVAQVPAEIQEYAANRKVVIYGSVWLADLPVVQNTIRQFPDFFHIVVPHDISASNMAETGRQLGVSSDIYTIRPWRESVMLVDTIGMLASLYSLASYAYIGGGFGKAIHNLLEPAVFGIPVCMGPAHTRFTEAVALKDLGVAKEVRKADDMAAWISQLESDPASVQSIRQLSETWFENNAGATKRITQSTQQFLEKQII